MAKVIKTQQLPTFAKLKEISETNQEQLVPKSQKDAIVRYDSYSEKLVFQLRLQLSKLSFSNALQF